MICPHCKKENSNEKDTVCAFCNQNMQQSSVKYENLVIEPTETPVTETVQEKPKKKKTSKIILILCIIIIVGLAGAIVPFVIGSVGEPTTQSAADIEWEHFTQAREEVIRKIRYNLKNPDSLQVHSVDYKNTPPEDDYDGVIDMNCKYIMKIDYSAQNGFGGMNRSIVYAKYYENGNVEIAFDSDDDYFNYYLAYSSYSYVKKY